MKYREVRNGIGDKIYIPIDDAGNYYCPICAEPWDKTPVYYSETLPSGEICQGCGIEFGCDDVPSLNGMTTEAYYHNVRVKWLSENAFKPQLLDRLSSILGIDIEPSQDQH